MKDTYDFGPEFLIHFYSKGPDGRLDSGDSGHALYYNFDDLFVADTMQGYDAYTVVGHKNQKLPKLEYTEKQEEMANGKNPGQPKEIGPFGSTNANIVTNRRVPNDENDVTIEYDIAQSIAENYYGLNDRQKKFALAFLERYLLSFEEVRDFQQTGQLDLSGVDKKFGMENMEIRANDNIPEKIRTLEWEAHYNNSPENLARVGMLNCCVVNDEKTTISTYNIETCIGLAISATDSNGKVHRIVTHNPYTGEEVTKDFEGGIEYYLKELEPIEKLSVMMCSMSRFKNLAHLEEDEQEILNRINNIFKFYKEKHDDFTIPFYRSWYVKISPQGIFEYANSKMVKTYREMENMGTLYNDVDTENNLRRKAM